MVTYMQDDIMYKSLKVHRRQSKTVLSWDGLR